LLTLKFVPVVPQIQRGFFDIVCNTNLLTYTLTLAVLPFIGCFIVVNGRQEMKSELAYLAHRCSELDKYRVETCCVIGELLYCSDDMMMMMVTIT